MSRGCFIRALARNCDDTITLCRFPSLFHVIGCVQEQQNENVVMSMSNLATNSFHDAYYTSKPPGNADKAPTPINQSAAILVADDFAERTVVTCMSILREAGIKVELIGATPHPVRGRYGISIVPDLSLSQFGNDYVTGSGGDSR